MHQRDIHTVPPGHARAGRQVLENRIVEGGLATLDRDRKQESSEHLGNRADLEHSTLGRTIRSGKRPPGRDCGLGSVGRADDEQAGAPLYSVEGFVDGSFERHWEPTISHRADRPSWSTTLLMSRDARRFLVAERSGGFPAC